jgi:hypothetical protein
LYLGDFNYGIVKGNCPEHQAKFRCCHYEEKIKADEIHDTELIQHIDTKAVEYETKWIEEVDRDEIIPNKDNKPVECIDDTSSSKCEFTPCKSKHDHNKCPSSGYLLLSIVFFC